MTNKRSILNRTKYPSIRPGRLRRFVQETIYGIFCSDAKAEMVIHTRGVVGSNPTSPTKPKPSPAQPNPRSTELGVGLFCGRM